MKRLGAELRDWGPPVFSLALAASAVGYAWSRGNSAADSIRQAERLGSSLSEMAGTARNAILTQDEYAALEARANDLKSRVEDSGKSALIAVQITEAVRRAGARFVGSEPLPESTPAPGTAGGLRYPRHRVTIEGGFRQVAEFLDGCGAQRLPLRVTELAITRAGAGAGGGATLRAVITVESYVPSKTGGPVTEART